jgi:HAE1 family hydrophobic/amphiphilic exporter-1
MMMLAILITGVASLSRLPLDITPEVDFPKLSVVTSWPFTSPETVEAFVTSPIEAVASTLRNVRSVSSLTEEGLSTVTVEFRRGTDMDFAAFELNERLSSLQETFPYGVAPPKIQKYVPKEFRRGRFLSYHLTGNFSLAELRRYALERIRPALLSIDGVVEVEVLGGKEEQLLIELDPDRLRSFGVKPAQIAPVLQDANIHLGAGWLNRYGKRFDILIKDPPLSPEQIERVILRVENGSVLRLGDVARVRLTYSRPRSLIRIDGQPAVVVNIEKGAGKNAIRVADRVFARIAELEKDFPDGLRLIKERDQSERIRQELADLSRRALFCVAVIFATLLLFLRNPAGPVIILSTIFFSVLLTLNFFYLTGISLNLITLAGLTLGFGMLVDTSIVVYDNILRKAEQGVPLSAAARMGTGEVFLPVLASTLTTVAAFIPFLYMTGELRLYYLPFAMAVGLSLLSSLLVAFTFTPVFTRFAIARWHVARSSVREHSRVWRVVLKFYPGMLRFCLRHRLLTVLVTLLVFAGSFYLFYRYVERGRIWVWRDQTFLRVYLRMPEGAELERADEVVRSIEKEVVGDPYVDRVFSRITADGAFIDITFPDSVVYSAYPYILKERLVARAAFTGGIDISVVGYGLPYARGGAVAPSFHLEVLGYNYERVKTIAERVGEKLKHHPRVREVNTAGMPWAILGRRELVLRLDRAMLPQFGLTVADVLAQIRHYLRETLAWQRVRIGVREIEYRVKMKNFRAFDLRQLQDLILEGSDGQKVRLRHIAKLEESRAPSQIERKDQQYRRWISFEFRGPYRMGARFVESVVKSTVLPPGYKLQRPRYFFMTEEEKRQIYWILAFSLLLVFMVTAALYESLRYPFVVILTVPLALIGVFLIFFFSENSFDRSAYIGVILLAGIVVNNAILLVHNIQLLHGRGLSLNEAAFQGALDRARPILMTSATTIIGLLPLVLFARAREGIWYALALSTIGGLLSSTFLVLLVTPVLYSLVSRKRRNGTEKQMNDRGSGFSLKM